MLYFSTCLTRIKSNWGTQTVSTTKSVRLRRYREIWPNAVPRSDSSSSQLGVTTRCALLQPTCEKDVKGTNNDSYFTLIIWNFDLVVSELDDETNGLASATVLDRVRAERRYGITAARPAHTMTFQNAPGTVHGRDEVRGSQVPGRPHGGRVPGTAHNEIGGDDEMPSHLVTGHRSTFLRPDL